MKNTQNIAFHIMTKKNSIMIALFLFLFSTAPLVYASEEQSTSEDFKETAAAIGDYTVEQKDAAIAKANELMQFFDEKMDVWEQKMEENWKDLQQTSRENYKATAKKLRKLRNEVSQWYGSMKYSSKETWEDVKQGFSDSYEKMANTFTETEKENPEGK